MNPQSLDEFAIPGRIQFVSGAGGLTKAVITTDASTAEIYLHGAHVTRFQKNGEPPLLFMSAQSQYTPGKPIRGGVPVCFPWFGPREGLPVHGFARLVEWELVETAASFDGGVKLIFRLPESAFVQANWPVVRVDLIVTIGDTLTLELAVANSAAEKFVFEGCFHTYFAVGDIAHVSIIGLNGVHYLDRLDNSARKLESGDEIRITSEVDRMFPDSPGLTLIHDAKLRRRISVQKTGADSTVVWNPWIAKAKAMPDFGDEEYLKMVCVESGSVGENRITLAPGATATLKAVIGSQAG